MQFDLYDAGAVLLPLYSHFYARLAPRRPNVDTTTLTLAGTSCERRVPSKISELIRLLGCSLPGGYHRDHAIFHGGGRDHAGASGLQAPFGVRSSARSPKENHVNCDRHPSAPAYTGGQTGDHEARILPDHAAISRPSQIPYLRANGRVCAYTVGPDSWIRPSVSPFPTLRGDPTP